MCGVVGYCRDIHRTTQNEDVADRVIFLALCKEACIRGVHAFGIAYYSEGQIHIRKSTNLQEVLDFLPEDMPPKVIFHNRYSTSGDWEDMNNNQPLFVNGYALAFNGTIDMGTKEEMEQRYNIKMQTDNDGEIVLNDIINGEPFKHLAEDKATFAGVYITPEGEMRAMRNNMRPLHSFFGCGGAFYCSTADIAVRAGVTRSSIWDIKANTIVGL